MRTPPNGPARLAITVVATILLTAPLGAQVVDSTHRWSVFGGSLAVASVNDGHLRPSNVEVGGSIDFRARSFPLPLRAGLSFSRAGQGSWASDLSFGRLDLDVVGRPLPRFLGTQLYLLGGLGVATRASFSRYLTRVVGSDPNVLEYFTLREPRQSWTFIETGVGLDVGRGFVQYKLQAPVASEGTMLAPLNVGFRF